MASRTYRTHGSGYQQPTHSSSQYSARRYAWENGSQLGPSQQQQQQQQQRYTADGHLSASAAQSDHDRSGSRGPSSTREQHRMDVDEHSDSSREMSLTKTAELFTALQNLPSLVAESKKEIRDMNQSASARSSHDIAELNGEIETLKVEKQKLEVRCVELSKNKSDADKIKRLEEDLQKAKASKDLYQGKYNDMALQHKMEHDKVEELEKTVRQHETDMNKISSEWESLNKQLSRKQALYEKAEEDKKKFESELSECKTRLSRLMGNKLANNNPDIADLSDKNRPTKLAEKNMELYDTQWTDAFEAFEDHFNDEKKSIQILLQVLKDIKAHCDKTTKEQEQKLHEAVVLKRTRDGSLPEYLTKQMKDFRRVIAEATLPEVQAKWLSGVKYKNYATLLVDERVQSFVKGCVELCWLMSVQDPPLEFGETPKSMDTFDINTYKYYTKTGPYVDYVVWPALYLHRDGPLLGKGVAQSHGRSQNVSDNQSASERKPSNNEITDADQRVESKPLGQTIDRQVPPKRKQNQYHGHDDISSSSQRHFVQRPDYEQTVVTGTNVSPDNSRLFSRTTKERDSTSVADRLNKDIGGSQREGVRSRQVQNPVRPKYPIYDRFKALVKVYGFGSPMVKAGMGENYIPCVEYYDYFYRK